MKLTHEKIDGDGCEFCNKSFNNPANHYGRYTCPYCKTVWQGGKIDDADATDAIAAVLDLLDSANSDPSDIERHTGLPPARCREIYDTFCRLLAKYQGKIR